MSTPPTDTTITTNSQKIEWWVSQTPVPYDAAITLMEERVKHIRQKNAPETIWLLEHEAVYTGGSSATPDDLLNAHAIPTRKTGRGGQWTYHAPGQRVIYIMLDVARRGQDIRAFVRSIEEWAIITLLTEFDIKADRRQGLPGVWVEDKKAAEKRQDKIAAIGIRLSSWVSWHGMAINVSDNLEGFDGIVPCGVRDGGVTSIEHLRQNDDRETLMKRLDRSLRDGFTQVFSPPSD